MPRRLVISAALPLVAGLLACSRAEGPAPVAWDRTRCAQCGMLVGEPAWAAQLRDADGRVLDFDDSGCLLVALAALQPEERAEVTRLYFHHHRQERWLRADEVAFAEVPHTPMGYGLGAVARGEAAGRVSLEDAQRRVLEQREVATRSRLAPRAEGRR